LVHVAVGDGDQDRGPAAREARLVEEARHRM
jgi:hypothetical protein